MNELQVISSNINFKEFRKIHYLYLKKLEKLTIKEREVITKYLEFIQTSYILIPKGTLSIQELNKLTKEK